MHTINATHKIAKAIVNAAAKNNIKLRLFGSVAVKIHCKDMISGSKPSNDIDLVADISQLIHVNEFFNRLGCKLDNSSPNFYLNGEHRTYIISRDLYNTGNDLIIDVYFGDLIFNHKIPHPYFDPSDEYTIPITQLLLSKLAIVELDENDISDICSILLNHQINGKKGNESIYIESIEKSLCTGFSGWCLTQTCLKNLHLITENLKRFNVEQGVLEIIMDRINKLINIILFSKKSILWKIRNLFKFKKICYFLVQSSPSVA